MRFANENSTWGYDRIQGALANVGYHISDQTVGNVLKRHGIEPTPDRKRRTTWKTFIKSPWDVLAAIDFTTVEVWTKGELVTRYLLSAFRPRLLRQQFLCTLLSRWIIQSWEERKPPFAQYRLARTRMTTATIDPIPSNAATATNTLRLKNVGSTEPGLSTLLVLLCFRALCESGSGSGVRETAGSVIFNIFSALAQFERRLIQERTKAGLAAARAVGAMGDVRESQKVRPRSYWPRAQRRQDARH